MLVRSALPPGLSVVLLDDIGGNPAAVGYLDALALGPLADGLVLGAVAASWRSGTTGTSRGCDAAPADTTGLQDEPGKGRTQLLGVCRADINLVADPVEAVGQGLISCLGR